MDRKIAIFVLLFLFSAHLLGLNWGLLHKERLSLIFSKEEEIEVISQKMVDWRRNVYKNRFHFFYEGKMAELDKDGTILDFSDELLTWSEVTGIRSYFVHAYHPDESGIFSGLANIRPGEGKFNPQVFQYGGAHLYPLGGFLLILSLIKCITLNPDMSYYFFHPEKISSLYIAARVFSIIAIWIGAIFLYLSGKNSFNKRTGFLSAVFLLVSPVVLFEGHLAKPHPICTAYSILTLYAGIKILLEGRKIWYIIGGIGAGLAIGSGIYTAPILLWPVFAHLFSYKRRHFLWAIYSVLIAIFVFCLSNPFYLLAFSDVKREFIAAFLSFEIKREFIGAGKEMAGSEKLFRQYPFSLFINEIWELKANHCLGYGIYILSILGIVYGLVRHSRIDLFLLLSILVSLAPFSFFTNYSIARYFLYILPISFLLGARIVDRGLNSPRFKKPVFLFLTLTLIYTALCFFVYIYGFITDGSENSSRLMAGKWINENLPKGNTIGITQLPHITHFPPFRFSNYKLVITKNFSKEELPSYFVVRKPDVHYDQIIKHYKLLKRIKSLPFKYVEKSVDCEIEIFIRKE